MKPNIIYILADDMGYGDVSCLNPESRIRTTHLDRLAATGMICEDAHASSAVCTPSRYSILTGRYNWRSTLKRGVTFGYSGPVIEEGRMTVASFLAEHGYEAACIGKWHLGWRWPFIDEAAQKVDWNLPITQGPINYGFKRFFGISASLDMPPYVYISQDRPTATPDRILEERTGMEFYRKGEAAPDFRHKEVLQRTTDEALAFIRNSHAANRPFFLYFPLSGPHTPILPLPQFQGKSGTNPYGDFCLQIDEIVGQVLQQVEALGIAENTIIIFTADNGCSPMADFEQLHALGHRPSYVFRGHKADIYEGGHRIPLIIRWPRVIVPGSRTRETVCLADLLATCADILDEKLPDNAGEDSISNLPVWQGGKLDHALREATIHHSIDGSFAIRQGRWKLEMCPGSGGWSSPRPGPECEGLPPVQLYDLDADISERRNVQAQHPDVVARLRALLTRYIEAGRSTPGEPQLNTGSPWWPQLWWVQQPGSEIIDD